MQGLDPARLRTSKYETYALDDELVFSGHKLVPRDAATFEELQPPWSKDKFGAYHWDKPVKGADIESFVGMSLGSAQDKNYRYRGEHPYCKLNTQAPATVPAVRITAYKLKPQSDLNACFSAILTSALGPKQSSENFRAE